MECCLTGCASNEKRYTRKNATVSPSRHSSCWHQQQFLSSCYTVSPNTHHCAFQVAKNTTSAFIASRELGSAQRKKLTSFGEIELRGKRACLISAHRQTAFPVSVATVTNGPEAWVTDHLSIKWMPLQFLQLIFWNPFHVLFFILNGNDLQKQWATSKRV